MIAHGAHTERSQRIAVVAIGILLALGFLAGRVAQLSIVDGEGLAARSADQYAKQIRLPAPRGAIFASTGEILAETVSVATVYASPRYHPIPAELRPQIAASLGVDLAIIERRLDSGKGFVNLARRVSRPAAESVMALRLNGVGIIEESRRSYPHGELAAHVLGFANSEMLGAEGLELRYDRWLRAPELVYDVERDGKGRIRFVGGVDPQQEDRSLAPGAELELTIDPRIQAIVERELAAGIEKFEADAGSVVVLDPSTGAIVALANFPTFDPNQAGSFSGAERRNRAITDVFEPGSTFKAFLASAAVDAGVITLDEEFDCEEGAYRIGRRTIHDTHSYSMLTLPEVIQYSSNIGTTKVAERMGRDTFATYLTGFGFGARTAVDLPGEVRGIMNPVAGWGPIELATTSFGQGIAVTPLQLAAGFAAIANGGIWHQPHVLARATSEEGRLLYAWEPTAAKSRRVIREETAREVGLMLESVVDGDGGTGKNARIAGVRVAGKTGTAQKARLDGRGYSSERIASFVGFAPADEPALVTLVMVDNPRKATYGGTVAAPIFREVMQRALDQVGLRPRLAPPSRMGVWPAVLPLEQESDEVDLPEGSLPSFVGMSLRRALAQANAFGFPVEFEGSGFVVEQLPLAGSSLPDPSIALQLRLEPSA
ncbi:penicillin-binding protein [Achromobacter marplatensis]|jgi:cell division protein FtsI (penicillin-binding protein 3)|uniref:penicillin-binding protein n=1 Tax=Achromobacter marplatensis TaxID=470868 RepID=UPI003C7445DD